MVMLSVWKNTEKNVMQMEKCYDEVTQVRSHDLSQEGRWIFPTRKFDTIVDENDELRATTVLTTKYIAQFPINCI